MQAKSAREWYLQAAMLSLMWIIATAIRLWPVYLLAYVLYLLVTHVVI